MSQRDGAAEVQMAWASSALFSFSHFVFLGLSFDYDIPHGREGRMPDAVERETALAHSRRQGACTLIGQAVE